MQPACVDGGGGAAPAAALLTARCAPAAGDEGETHAERLRRLDAEVAALRSAAAQGEAGPAAKVRSLAARGAWSQATIRPIGGIAGLLRPGHTERSVGTCDAAWRTG
jgi:hypothetical protein